MVSVHRYHEISESTHLILNPLSDAKVDLVAEIAGLGPDTRMLDLACGRGEMLCRYAAGKGINGVGVDIWDAYIEDARTRAAELGVVDRVEFLAEEAAAYAAKAEMFDVVSVIGATWIGDGLGGTLDLIRPIARPGGFALIGDVYLMPTGRVGTGDEEGFFDLPGVLDRVEASGFELVEMVLANHDDWDRYASSQWLNVARWLDAHPDDPDAPSVRETRDDSRRSYLQKDRDHMGWGVFVLRPMS